MAPDTRSMASSVSGPFLPLLAVGCAGLAFAASVSLGRQIAKYLAHRQEVYEYQTKYDLVIDLCGFPERKPWPVTGAMKKEKCLDALAICVLGDYKVGKTFLINQLCGLRLPSSDADHTLGLSIKQLAYPRDRLVFIDTAGHGAPYDIRQESADDRAAVENLLGDLAYQLSDIQIVVCSNCKMRDQDMIISMRQAMAGANTRSKQLLMVVHNFSRITDPDVLETAFVSDVITRLHLQPVGLPDRLYNHRTRFVWIDRSDTIPIYHFLLAKEGSPAGNKFNPQTYQSIFEMCVCRIGSQVPHSFLESLFYFLNEKALLWKHLRSRAWLKWDSSTSSIVIDDTSLASTPQLTARSMSPATSYVPAVAAPIALNTNGRMLTAPPGTTTTNGGLQHSARVSGVDPFVALREVQLLVDGASASSSTSVTAAAAPT